MRSEDNIRRIFVSIPVSEKIKEEIARIREANKSQKRLIWTRENNLHVTVYFIGNIRSEDFSSVNEIVRGIVSGQEIFRLKFERITLAPPNKKSRMIWLRFFRNEIFTDIANRIHLSLRDFVSLNPYHFRDPIPHITLARFNSTFDHSRLILDQGLEIPDIEVMHCELWESIKAIGGVQYIPIEKFPMKHPS